MNGTALFGIPGDARSAWDLTLNTPSRIMEARRMDQVLPLLSEVERACGRGMWAALMVAYEAAPAFDPVLATHGPGEFPLAWAALYRERAGAAPKPRASATKIQDWQRHTSRDEYERSISAIHSYITQGETYQVNYTIGHTARFRGEPLSWHLRVARGAGQGYSAFLDMGDHVVASFSPELFFRRRGNTVVTRPMKGTSARGRWLGEDLTRKNELAACPKNRAENVMIVDLIRSDLGKVAATGTVRAGPLFEVETYPSVHQMTSTVTAEIRPGVDLPTLFRALFPCGSVTGAPKVRTMEIIRELEPGPRRAYCGAVGYVAPGGDCAFNVPIRTVMVDKKEKTARFHVGGGITADSTGRGEYEECGSKMLFLTSPAPRFRLLESLLLYRGRILLLDEHMTRLRDSARYFGFAFDEDKTRTALMREAGSWTGGKAKMRLLLGRTGRMEIQVADLPPIPPSPLRVALAKDPVDSANPMLQHKTTQRGVYERARRQRPDADEVLLFNERGMATELCFANLVLEMDGQWITPPREDGLLAGAMRERLLKRGVLRERSVAVEDLSLARRLWLVNSVRGWRRIILDENFTRTT